MRIKYKMKYMSEATPVRLCEVEAQRYVSFQGTESEKAD